MNKYTNYDELPLMLTPADIGEFLMISKNNAYALVHSQGFPAFKIGKQYRITRESFLQWLEAQSTVKAA